MIASSLLLATMPWASLAGDQALVSLGAGVSGYTDGALRAATGSVGAAWDLRFTLGVRARFAVEAEYLGTYASLTGSGATPFVVSNGATAQLRVNLLDRAFCPFFFVGAGYDRAELHARDADLVAAARFSPVADRFVLPLGAGFDVTFVRHLDFDLRVSFRPYFGSSLLAGARDDQWLVTTHVGWAF
jgi:hypothetical protein